jgi:sialate O-acetylesterase
MVVITDAGEANDIHPQAKDVPGRRLASVAASLDLDSIDASFPTFAEMSIVGNEAILRFENTSGGLNHREVRMNTTRNHLPGQGPEAVSTGDVLSGFTIAGEDGQFVEAEARILSEDSVAVWAAGIENPVAVRYAWSNFPLANLYGGNGMPAVPFRSDDFPMPSFSQ